jgi:hypothetical protein
MTLLEPPSGRNKNDMEMRRVLEGKAKGKRTVLSSKISEKINQIFSSDIIHHSSRVSTHIKTY